MKRLGAVAALFTAALFGCGAEEVVVREPVVRPVKTLVVGGAGDERLSFPGTVQASDRAELAFRVAGPLVELPVDEGDAVRRGQFLARIDPRDFEIALAQARAAYEQGEADYARYKNLYERNAVPLAEFEFRRAARDVAAASYDQAQSNLRDTALVAPFTGRIGRKYVQNFEDVVAKEPILSLHDISTVEVVIDVPESVMATFRNPSNAAFTASFSSAPGSEFALKLEEAAAEADPQTQTFQVTFSMPQPDELRVLPGMTAEVALDIQAGDDVAEGAEILIPADAVFASANGEPRVWVVDTNALTVQSRNVRVGAVTGESSIRVLEGLERGETIAVAAVHQLQDGSKIRLMERRN